MSYVIHMTTSAGRSAGFVKRQDDHRRAATFATRVAANHLAAHLSANRFGMSYTVLHYDDAFGTTGSDDAIIHA